MTYKEKEKLSKILPGFSRNSMEIVREKTQYHEFAFVYPFSREILDYCRYIKDLYGWQQFTFYEGKWRFRDPNIALLIRSRYPSVVIPEGIEVQVKKLDEDKKMDAEIAENAEKLKKAFESTIDIKGIKGTLYPYQKVAVEFFINNKGRAILADEMGTGKTLQSLAFLVHTKKQRSLVVCPASVKYGWSDEVEKWTRLKPFVVDSKTDFNDIPYDVNVVVINFDILKKHFNQLMKVKWDAVVVDECFAGETLVDTPMGGRRIDEICIGDEVINAVGTGMVTGISVQNKKTKDLLEVKTTHGDIVVTRNHPFLTQVGFVPACDLDGTHVIISSYESLRILSQNDSSKDMETTFLREVLLSEVENDATICPRKGFHKREIYQDVEFHEEISQGKSTECNKCKYSNDGKKSNVCGRCKDKGNQNPPHHGKQTNGTTWKWLRSNKNREENNGIFSRIVLEFFNFSWKKNPGISDKLQGRPFYSREKAGLRGGWGIPRTEREEDARYKEGETVDRARVVSVQNYKPRGGEGPSNGTEEVKVYNLMVSGHPSFSVSDMIVHNCHMIKSNTAIRTKAVKAIVRDVSSVLLLSGTPLLSRPIELFNSLQIMDPKTWSNWYDFTRRYCQGHQTRWGWEAKGASNIEELQQKISRYFLRRTKDEVLPHLPKKIFVDYAVDLTDTHHKEYKTAQEHFAKYLREYKNKKSPEIARMVQAEKLTKINFLRQITTAGKMAAADELIENVIDSGQKVLVFSCFNEPIETLHKKYKNSSVLLTGKTPAEDRRDIIAKFQNDPEVKIFFGGIVAAGVGITLTAATTAIFLDYSWNPADHSQAIDRMHRPGATSESVTIYQLYSRNTIDEFMRKILVRKKKIFDALIEGGRLRKDGSIVDQFIDEIMQEYEETLDN